MFLSIYQKLCPSQLQKLNIRMLLGSLFCIDKNIHYALIEIKKIPAKRLAGIKKSLVHENAICKILLNYSSNLYADSYL